MPESYPKDPGTKLLNACPACGQHLDVSEIEPFSKIECPTCDQPIRVRTEFDHFSIKRMVGEGGMSRVFEARDNTLGRDVALKILNRSFSKDSSRIGQFEREAKITASISHPNVVKLYSVGEDQGFFYIAMELIEDASLEQEIVRQGRIPEAQVLSISLDVVDGLRTAFNSSLIHRDLKPGNILLDAEGTPRIVDFGLALMIERDIDESGEIWATPFYVPPEKLYKQPEDFRSDIYSLGATLFHLLAGQPPFQAETNSIEELKLLKERPVSLAHFAPDVSAPTCAVIDRMMARNPEERYESYTELYEALKLAKGQLDGTIIAKPELSHAAATEVLKANKSKAPLIAGLSFGAVAIAAIAVLLMVIKPWKDSGPGGADGDGGSPASGSNGGKTTSELFTEARQALLDGNYVQAQKDFSAIASAESTVQPTKNRARLNAGICALLQGNETESRGIFGEIFLEGKFSDKPEDQELADFYVNASRKLMSEESIAPSIANSIGAGAEQGSGLLAFGLKNWEMGDLDRAVAFFEAFQKVDLPEQMTAYRSLAGRYLSDRKLAESMPGEVEDLKFRYCDESLTKLREIKDKTQTRGYVPRLIDKRIDYFQSRYADLKAEYEAEQAELSRQRLAAEGKAIGNLMASLHSHSQTYAISDAIKILETADFSVDEIRAVQAEELALWRESERFISTLVGDMGTYGYRGDIARRNSTPLRGEVVTANRTALKIKYGNATTSIPLADIPPDGLLEIAEKLIKNVSDTDEYYLRRELYVSFARQMGRANEALSAANKLSQEKRDFRAKWQRISSRPDYGKSDL